MPIYQKTSFCQLFPDEKTFLSVQIKEKRKRTESVRSSEPTFGSETYTVAIGEEDDVGAAVGSPREERIPEICLGERITRIRLKNQISGERVAPPVRGRFCHRDTHLFGKCDELTVIEDPGEQLLQGVISILVAAANLEAVRIGRGQVSDASSE